ncbi:beta-galactosidase [Paenibacillus agaridevorans]|uniref:Beta-galactosidase n=1 Tax=Paenibacillus agaridevorans TaxID=171404 RepID=A0A2R5EST3_9BACL|nr:alpha-amylase family protein [Paenibacillus agaridevorans]GBG06461.1 beta-galactosidase [Paenibacillus agaridevorans]
MRQIKRAVHIDFHTLPDIPDFGANFDAKIFAQTLKDAKVEFINAFAKCNIGYAYYPTEVGVMHPHLNFDMFGETVEECRKLGIGVTAYFNLGLDHEMARKHREWTIVNKEGQVIYGDRTEHFFRNMCLNSGYGDYMLAMIKEVLDRYPVEGVFLDCINMHPSPCYGNECSEDMHKRGMDPLNDEQVLAFSRLQTLEFCRKVKSLVGDDKFLYLNGLHFGESEGLSTHSEIECLPGLWGYDFFPAQVAYARNLGIQVFYMTGRFQASWGDFGGLKTKTSLENDCWDAISNAVTTSVGDHMHPRDGLDPAVYKMIGEVYTEIEKYEPWTDNAKAVAEIGVMVPVSGVTSKNHFGAVRILGELKYTYDLLDERMDLSPYRLIILPDDLTVSEMLKEKLEQHLAEGKGIISSGYGGLNPEKTKFAIDAWNLDYDGPDPWNLSYFKMLEDTGEEVPDMMHAVYKQGIQMQLKNGAQMIADYIQPYFNRHWDGFHGYFYAPPEKSSGRPALARSGNIFQFSFNIFSAYNEYAMVTHKNMVKYCLAQLLPDPLIKCENIPSTTRVTVTKKEDMRMIHIKTTHPEKRGNYTIVEDSQLLTKAVVSVKGQHVEKVYMAPTGEALAYEIAGEYIRIPLPDIDGYLMVVVAEGV